ARVPFDEAAALLADIDHDDRTGLDGARAAGAGWSPGPRALGALPFVPGNPAELVVPATMVVKSADGACWVTTVGDGAGDPLAPPAPPTPAASEYRIRPVTPVDTYLAAVAAARDAVRAGRITKAVIAREVEVTASSPI